MNNTELAREKAKSPEEFAILRRCDIVGAAVVLLRDAPQLKDVITLKEQGLDQNITDRGDNTSGSDISLNVKAAENANSYRQPSESLIAQPLVSVTDGVVLTKEMALKEVWRVFDGKSA